MPITAPHAIRETTAGDPLVVVSTWRPRPGREHDLEQVLERLAGDSGVVLHEADAAEYHIARRFHDREAMQRWHDSAERAALHRDLDEVAERAARPSA